MILFRKQLLLDSDPQAIAKAKAVLQENGVRKRVVPKFQCKGGTVSV